MAAFAIVIVLLTVGMGLVLRRIEDVTADQLAHVKAEEKEITLVERLRSSGDLLVSAGRGYLIYGDDAQLANLNLAKAEFDSAVRALRNSEVGSIGQLRVEKVRAAATRFRDLQEDLLRDRRAGRRDVVAQRFDSELIPARQVLRAELDQLVGHKTALLDSMYNDAKEHRARLSAWTYGLLATLVFASLAVSWTSAKRLARTYRREVEALEVARQAVVARDELMGIVAHDLRNPLGAISIRAELLEETTSEPRTREQAAAIDNIATRMAHIIKTLLDLTVIEAGHLVVQKEPCEVGAIVKETLEMVSTIAASKHVQVEERVPQPGLVVLADRERIYQVLSNLLGNAIKFTPSSGRITLSVERAGDLALFAVSDTGPGISPADMPRVFDRYWKSDTRGTKGTGLGLYIAKSIIEAHRGRIEAESSPGGGATFRFTLPLAPASSRTEAIWRAS